MLSSYRHGICLSILLKIRWGVRNTFAFLDCSLPFHPGGGKKNNNKNSMGFWSIPWCTWDGLWTHGRLVVSVVLNHNEER